VKYKKPHGAVVLVLGITYHKSQSLPSTRSICGFPVSLEFANWVESRNMKQNFRGVNNPLQAKDQFTTKGFASPQRDSDQSVENGGSLAGSKSVDNLSIWREWDIIMLALCWALTLTTSTLLTTIGPLSAQELGASDDFAAFTIGVFLLGAAMSSFPSGLLFRHLGRFRGFAVGCLCQMIGSLFGSLAMSLKSVTLLFIGCAFVGLGQGLGQFYRFSAVELCPDNLKSEAVTLVLTGGVLAAFLGPTSANYTKTMLHENYFGSFLIMGVIGFLNLFTVAMVRFKDHKVVQSGVLLQQQQQQPLIEVPPRRPTMEILSQPLFILSCAVATVAHTVMVMLMSNCALAMKADGHTFQEQTLVMEVHFCAMFMPGFVTGRFIKAKGTYFVSAVGAGVFAVSAVVFALGKEDWNFFLGMILLGGAWNLNFSSGTVMLTECYRPSEATDVQAANDLILFTIAGLGSLASGFIYSSYGWDVLVYSVSGMMVLNILLMYFARSIKSNTEVLRLTIAGTDSGPPSRASSVAEIMGRLDLESSMRQTLTKVELEEQLLFEEEWNALQQQEKVRQISVA